MPLYDFRCSSCGQTKEVLAQINEAAPICCGLSMQRLYIGKTLVKEYGALWIDRMNEIHKRQSDKGERLRFVHPSEIL